MSKEWFDEWFNSPYYHILYKNRDYREAQLLVDNLVNFLKVQRENKILDIACGKGRHSFYLNRLGFDVTGIDLSKHNIEFAMRCARRFANDRLHFFVHDMRRPFAINQFDFAINLFTSFGYFQTEVENIEVIKAAVQSLKPKGKLVIDFFNVHRVLNCLIPSQTKTIDKIEFKIKKEFKDGFIIKTIEFIDKGKEFKFTERVKAIDEDEFKRYFSEANVEVLELFGDYELNKFNKEKSDRMIFIVQKKTE